MPSFPTYEYALRFEDGTWYTGYASTLAEMAGARTPHLGDALWYTIKGAYAVAASFPTLKLTVEHAL